MAKIPDSVKKRFIVFSNYFDLINQGKVRDTYELSRPASNQTKMLAQVASDRISIFDFVLNDFIPQKGEVLTALTHYWLTKVINGFHNHLITDIDMPGYKLDGFDLKRTLFIKKIDIAPYEMVYRAHLGGSVYKDYLATSVVAGQRLPVGIKKWEKLPEPLFTPTTKEENGHDIPIDVSKFLADVGENVNDAFKIIDTIRNAYAKAYQHAEKKGILILDTKIEAAFRKNGRVIIGDEIFTPDSSRFVDAEDYAKAMAEGRDPKFYDKEVVREWGRTVKTPFKKNGKQIIGINNLDPGVKEHSDFVHSLSSPMEVKEETQKRYLKIFERITGVDLKTYQKAHLVH